MPSVLIAPTKLRSPSRIKIPDGQNPLETLLEQRCCGLVNAAGKFGEDLHFRPLRAALANNAHLDRFLHALPSLSSRPIV
jgi:hypothetical protein